MVAQLSPVMAWRFGDDEELWRAFEWWSEMGRVIVFGGKSSSNSSIYEKQVAFDPNIFCALITSLLQSPPSPPSFCSSHASFINTKTYPPPPPPPLPTTLPLHHPDRIPPQQPSPWSHMTLKYSYKLKTKTPTSRNPKPRIFSLATLAARDWTFSTYLNQTA
jgi:hypothetical protein